MRFKPFAVALGLGAMMLVSAAGPSFSQDAAAKPEAADASGRGSACKADFERLCASAEGRQARGACFKEKEAQFSAECKAATAARQERWKAVREACKADTEALCKTAAGDGEGRGGMRCLRDNQAKLSKDCSGAMAELPQRNTAN